MDKAKMNRKIREILYGSAEYAKDFGDEDTRSEWQSENKLWKLAGLILLRCLVFQTFKVHTGYYKKNPKQYTDKCCSEHTDTKTSNI